MQSHGQGNGGQQPDVRPRWHRHQRLILRQAAKEKHETKVVTIRNFGIRPFVCIRQLATRSHDL